MAEFIRAHFLLIAFILYSFSFAAYCFSRKGVYRLSLVVAFIIHGTYLIASGHFGEVFLFLKVVENPAFLPFTVSAALLLLELRKPSQQPWGLGIIVTLVFTLIALLTPQSMVYFGPNKLSIWAVLYFITDFTGQGCFFLGAFFSALFLLGETDSEINFSLIAYGFVFHTLAQVTGAVWCFLGWAATFQWVFVHLQSAAVWIFYANYLHLRFLPSWNGKRRSVYLIAGAVMIAVFKYL